MTTPQSFIFSDDDPRNNGYMPEMEEEILAATIKEALTVLKTRPSFVKGKPKRLFVTQQSGTFELKLPRHVI